MKAQIFPRVQNAVLTIYRKWQISFSYFQLDELGKKRLKKKTIKQIEGLLS